MTIEKPTTFVDISNACTRQSFNDLSSQSFSDTFRQFFEARSQISVGDGITHTKV